jgi:phage FluMu protein Com
MSTVTEPIADPRPEPAVSIDTADACEDTRCRKCRRLLFKATLNPLRAGALLESKCPSCNTLNYLVGRPEL